MTGLPPTWQSGGDSKIYLAAALYNSQFLLHRLYDVVESDGSLCTKDLSVVLCKCGFSRLL